MATGPARRRTFAPTCCLAKLPLKSGPKLSIVQHVSYETYVASRFNVLASLYHNAAPSPSGPHLYSAKPERNPGGVDCERRQQRFSYGPVTLSYSLPFALMNRAVVRQQPDRRRLGYEQRPRKTGAQLSSRFDRFRDLCYLTKSVFLKIGSGST